MPDYPISFKLGEADQQKLRDIAKAENRTLSGQIRHMSSSFCGTASRRESVPIMTAIIAWGQKVVDGA